MKACVVKSSCYSQLSLSLGSSSLCSKTAVPDDCYLQFAQSRLDSTVCPKIQNSAKRDDCINLTLSSSPSILICPKLSTLSLRNSCFESVASANADINACSKITSDLNLSNSCISKVALLKRDLSLCSTLPKQSLKDDCISSIAVLSDSTSNCSGISDKLKKANCIKQVAISLQDSSLCSQAYSLDKTAFDKCLVEIAGLKADASICNGLYSSNSKPECIGGVAIALNDSSLCSTLPLGPLLQAGAYEKRDECLLLFAQETQNSTLCAQLHEGFKTKCDCFFNSQLSGCAGAVGSLSVSVHSFDGNALQNIQVAVYRQGLYLYNRLPTSSDGVVLFENISEGNYSVTPSDPLGFFESSSSNVSVPRGSQASLSFTLNRACNSNNAISQFQSDVGCCYLGKKLSNNQLYYASDSDNKRLLCSENQLYSCGNPVECTASNSCVSPANISGKIAGEIVSGLTCSSAGEWN